MPGLDTNYFVAGYAVPARATHSFGTACFTLPYTPPTPPAVDLKTFLGMMKSVSYSNHQIAKLEVSHLFSPLKYREFIPGFGDGGQLQMTFLYSGAVYESLYNEVPYLLDGSGALINPEYNPPAHGRIRMVLEDPWGNTLAARGFMQPPTIEVPEDGVIMCSSTFEITGPPVFTRAVGAP